MGLGLFENLTQEERDSLERDAIEKMAIYRLDLLEGAKAAIRAEGKIESMAQIVVQLRRVGCDYSLISQVLGLYEIENYLENKG